MPLTVVSPLSGPLGPGFQITVQRPEGVDINWHWKTVLVWQDEQAVSRAWTFDQNSDGQVRQTIILQQGQGGFGFEQGGNLSITLELEDQFQQLVDAIALPTGQYQYDGTTNLAAYLQHLEQVAGSFTEEDRATINTTQTTTEETNQLSLAINEATQATMQLGATVLKLPIGQVLASNLLDFLSDRQLSGGVTCDPVRYDASLNALYGVVVNVTQFPDDWQFRTPDQSWGFHDLATVRIIRGGNLVERHGIHTLTHTVYPLPGLPFPWLVNLAAPLQPPDYHIWVDWAEGVCGELIGLALP